MKKPRHQLPPDPFSCPHGVSGRICWRCTAAEDGWRSAARQWWLLRGRRADFRAAVAQHSMLVVATLGAIMGSGVGVMFAASTAIIIGVIRGYEGERRI